jgi:hypothetical protein
MGGFGLSSSLVDSWRPKWFFQSIDRICFVITFLRLLTFSSILSAVQIVLQTMQQRDKGTEQEVKTRNDLIKKLHETGDYDRCVVGDFKPS